MVNLYYSKHGKIWDNVLIESRKILDIAPVNKKNIFVLPLLVRNILKIETGKTLGYYKEPDGKIILATGGQLLLAAAKLTGNNSMVLPKDVRDALHINATTSTQKRIAFYQEPDGKISLEISEINIDM